MVTDTAASNEVALMSPFIVTFPAESQYIFLLAKYPEPFVPDEYPYSSLATSVPLKKHDPFPIEPSSVFNCPII